MNQGREFARAPFIHSFTSFFIEQKSTIHPSIHPLIGSLFSLVHIHPLMMGRMMKKHHPRLPLVPLLLLFSLLLFLSFISVEVSAVRTRLFHSPLQRLRKQKLLLQQQQQQQREEEEEDDESTPPAELDTGKWTPGPDCAEAGVDCRSCLDLHFCVWDPKTEVCRASGPGEAPTAQVGSLLWFFRSGKFCWGMENSSIHPSIDCGWVARMVFFFLLIL